MSVIVSKQPNRVVELLEYLSLIRYAAYNAAFTTDRRTQSVAAGEPVNILEHALHSSNGSNKVQEYEILVCS